MQVDAPPYILTDETGLQLISPPAGWQQRPDMHPDFTRRLRATMVARSGFIEDLVTSQSQQGIRQYILLGAGLDTFAQRRPDITSRLAVYEVDQPDTQAWKQQRLKEEGYPLPDGLHFVAVDFEQDFWWEALLQAGFDTTLPAVVACTGVTLYLTREAISATLRQVATLAPGSTLAMTFYLPMELMDEEDRPLQAIAEKGARESGTPFVSFFAPHEVIHLAQQAGFKDAKLITDKDLARQYFAGRSDGLLPSSGELFLVATT